MAQLPTQRIGASAPIYQADMEEIKERLDEIWQLQRRIPATIHPILSYPSGENKYKKNGNATLQFLKMSIFGENPSCILWGGDAWENIHASYTLPHTISVLRPSSIVFLRLHTVLSASENIDFTGFLHVFLLGGNTWLSPFYFYILQPLESFKGIIFERIDNKPLV